MQDLSGELSELARAIARTLEVHGKRAWIVGGAVRDLALGREVDEIDMASAATPEEVERLFERTIPIGRNFGTLVIHTRGRDVEHTTFRSEKGYSDARRPDAVRFGASPEEDAKRRDFTCNALYLDPLSGAVLDPEHGLDDLAAGRLACVGDARRRFEEDGLRLVRMARFAGALGLEPRPETLAAARASADSLRGVSRERVLLELTAIMKKGGAARAVELLDACGLLERALPGFEGLRPAGVEHAPWIARRLALLRSLPGDGTAGPGRSPGPGPGLHLGIAALLGPDPEAGPARTADIERSRALVESLRGSRELQDGATAVWTLVAAFRGEPDPPRSTRLRWMRRREFRHALELARAWSRVLGEDAQALEALALEREALGDALNEAALLGTPDLAARGLAPGPVYGTILREAETLQLDRKLRTREEALRWLDARVQEGGNALRNPHATG